MHTPDEELQPTAETPPAGDPYAPSGDADATDAVEDRDAPWSRRPVGTGEPVITWIPAETAPLDPSLDVAPSRSRGHIAVRMLVRETIQSALLALLVFLTVRASFQNFKVDGSSMYPTLEDGQFLVVNKLSYSKVDVGPFERFLPFMGSGGDAKRNVFDPPKRGEIVVLKRPGRPQTDLVKRVIGLPGETIEIRSGRVYINDHLLEEPYIRTPWQGSYQKIRIPEGEYFVMGDNREHSSDSRFAAIGLIPEELIIGKVVVTYWPADRLGLASNDRPTLSATTTADRP